MPLYDNVCTWYGSAFLYPHSQHQNLSYPTEHYYCEDHHYLTFRKRNYIETKHTGRDENGSLNIPGEYAYNIRKLNEPPHIKARHIIRKTIDERPEFEEICLHALIHHTRYGECKYCTEVNSDYLHDTIFVKERRLSDGKLTISKSKNLKNNDFAKKINARIQRETLKDDERRILKVGAKYKPKDVYKSIRTAKTREPIETSIPEISKLSSRNIKLKQRPKFISEKDFKKKFEKTETIKFQKQLKDESKSATSCMVEYAASSKREPEKVMQSKSSTKTVLFDEDYRCTVVSLKYSLEKVAWIIFILLVLLLITE